MSRLEWDQVGERLYEAGVDRGVLYLDDGTGVVWNGLVSVSEILSDESAPYYLDGVKYLDSESLGDFSATLQAVTFPEEFQPYQGSENAGNGFFVGDQKPKAFGLSYRTMNGNDVAGIDAGYKIHILYNLLAIAESNTFDSLSNSVSPLTFSWTLVATPETFPNYRPTAHIALDSSDLDPDVLETITDILYGTDVTTAQLPTMIELFDILFAEVGITITDNGDGTWTATGHDQHFTMLDATTFQIDNVDATYLDADTYEVSTTEL